jgi:DNA-directed RNA polymerase specialized sigma24 family protein
MTERPGLVPAGERWNGNSLPGGAAGWSGNPARGGAAAWSGAERRRPRSGGVAPGETSPNRVAPDKAAPGDVAPNDAALIRAIGEGSESAFRLLFARWALPLRRFLVRATGSSETGDDLLQEAFLRVLRAAFRYTPDAPPGAWLYRICANLSYSFWRKESRAPRVMSALGGRDRADQAANLDANGLGRVAGGRGLPGWNGSALARLRQLAPDSPVTD